MAFAGDSNSRRLARRGARAYNPLSMMDRLEIPPHPIDLTAL
jgi:hypothetical protein